MNAEKECAHLQLIDEMGHELAVALDGLRGKKPSAPVNLYLFPMCQGLCLLSAGFLKLKKEKNDHAARVLIRTAVETALKLGAVYEKPTNLYRIAYSEHLEDGKFLQAADENQVVTDPAKHAAKWDKEKATLAALFPGQELKEEKISAYDLAREAKVPYLYDFHFRLYCNYTHATLRAHVNPEHIVREADYAALEAILHIALVVARDRLGAPCAQLADFFARVQALKPDVTPQALE